MRLADGVGLEVRLRVGMEGGQPLGVGAPAISRLAGGIMILH
jgi:hypothetical protein